MVDNPVWVTLSGQDWGTCQGQSGLNRSPNPMQAAPRLGESQGLASPSVHGMGQGVGVTTTVLSHSRYGCEDDMLGTDQAL